MKRAFLFAAAAAVLVSCGPSGKLAGKVTVTGGSASLAAVTLTGGVVRAAAVAEDGSFAFEGVPDGVYLVEAVAPSTLEGAVRARAEVKGGEGTVAELVLTGVGRVAGRVSSPTGAAGAEVFVAGLPVRTNVAQDGSFTLERVPAGEQTLVAVRDGYEPTTLRVTVPFDAVLENQVLALTEIAHGPGRISGRAYLFDAPNHAGITVKVEGTQLSAQTDAQGQYTLTGVPLGYVNLVAEAQGYEPARLQNVLSASGGTLRPPDLRLSYAARRFAGYVYDFAVAPDGKGLLFVGVPEFDSSTWLYWLDVSANAAPVQLLRYGTGSVSLDAFWGADSRKVAFRFNSGDTLYAADLGAGEVSELSQRLHDATVKLAGDRVFFLERGEDSVPALAAWSFGAKEKRIIEQVRSGGACPYNWIPSPYHVSKDGKAAYFAEGANGALEVHVWNGTVQKVTGAAAIQCLSFRGDGTQLLGLSNGTDTALYNLTSGAQQQLIAPYPSGLFEYPPVMFTGDNQYAWYITLDAATAVRTLRAVPVTGGAPVTLQTGGPLYGTSSTYVDVQPGGSQLAFRNAAGDVQVKRADGTLLKSFTSPGGSVNMLFGPTGEYFVHVFSTERKVRLADTATYNNVRELGEIVTGGSPVSFSPKERAVYFYARQSTTSARYQFFRTASGQPLDLPFLASGVPQVQFSPTDGYLLLGDDSGDRVVNLETGAVVNLERAAYELGFAQPPLFTGDETRLVFAEEPYGDGRLFAASTSASAPARHIADGEGNGAFGTVPGTARLWAVDYTSSGEPRGVYTLTVP